MSPWQINQPTFIFNRSVKQCHSPPQNRLQISLWHIVQSVTAAWYKQPILLRYLSWKQSFTVPDVVSLTRHSIPHSHQTTILYLWNQDHFTSPNIMSPNCMLVRPVQSYIPQWGFWHPLQNRTSSTTPWLQAKTSWITAWVSGAPRSIHILGGARNLLTWIVLAPCLWSSKQHGKEYTLITPRIHVRYLSPLSSTQITVANSTHAKNNAKLTFTFRLQSV